MSKISLLSKPFRNALRETSSNLSQIQESLDMITGVITPIANEIEAPFNATNAESFSNESRSVRTTHSDDRQQIDAKIVQQRYVTKIYDRCKQQMDRAVKKCDKSFADAYDRCYDKLPTAVNTLLCWPMKIDSMCNVFESDETETMCDSANIIDRDFGDTYVELKTLERSLQKNADDKVNIDTSISIDASAEIQ